MSALLRPVPASLPGVSATLRLVRAAAVLRRVKSALRNVSAPPISSVNSAPARVRPRLRVVFSAVPAALRLSSAAICALSIARAVPTKQETFTSQKKLPMNDRTKRRYDKFTREITFSSDNKADFAATGRNRQTHRQSPAHRQ